MNRRGARADGLNFSPCRRSRRSASSDAGAGLALTPRCVRCAQQPSPDSSFIDFTGIGRGQIRGGLGTRCRGALRCRAPMIEPLAPRAPSNRPLPIPVESMKLGSGEGCREQWTQRGVRATRRGRGSGARTARIGRGDGSLSFLCSGSYDRRNMRWIDTACIATTRSIRRLATVRGRETARRPPQQE